MKTGAGKFCASVVLPMPGCPCRTMIGGSFAVVRMICISMLQWGTEPVAADFGFGLERHAKAVGLAGLTGMASEDLAYLLGDGWPATSHELVVDPERQVDVAVGAVAEARAERGVCVDQPTLADDCFARGNDAIERLVVGFCRNPSPVESLDPALLAVLARETCAQLFQTGCRIDEPVESALTSLL